MRLVLVGSVLADVTMLVPRLPERGGDTLARSMSVETGGGFNVLAAAVRAGLPAALAGRTGAGPFGAMVRTDLAAEGIVPLLPPPDSGDTGISVTIIEPDGERTFLTSPGVESELSAQALSQVEIHPTDTVYVSGYDLLYPVTGPSVAGWVGTLPSGTVLAVDTGPLADQIPADVFGPVLGRTDLLSLNKRETGLLTEGDDPASAAAQLLARLRPDALVAMRRGKEGAYIAGKRLGDQPVAVAAPGVRVVDTTGAGDTFTGVFIAELAGGADPVGATRRACAAAALSVSKRGSATAPTAAELKEFLAG